MKRKICLLTLALSLTVCLAACGGPTSEVDPTPSAPNVAPTDSPMPSAPVPSDNIVGRAGDPWAGNDPLDDARDVVRGAVDGARDATRGVIDGMDDAADAAVVLRRNQAQVRGLPSHDQRADDDDGDGDHEPQDGAQVYSGGQRECFHLTTSLYVMT